MTLRLEKTLNEIRKKKKEDICTIWKVLKIFPCTYVLTVFSIPYIEDEMVIRGMFHCQEATN